MPIPTLDTTIGGANANSYIALVDADTYFDSRLNSAPWTDANADNRTRALLMATNRLQVENWLGERVTTTQRLAWPRIDVQKVDPVGVGYWSGYGHGYWWGWGEFYTTTEIPQQVKDAQCELALAYLQGFDDGTAGIMESFSADGVSVKFRGQRPVGVIEPRIQQLICELTAGNELRRA